MNQSKDRIVKVGLIGCGGIANGKHLPSLSKQKTEVQAGVSEVSRLCPRFQNQKMLATRDCP